MSNRISRRHVLRQAGALISLPFLEGMLPAGIRAATTGANKPPVRLVWLFAGSGMHIPDYKPAKTGRDWTATPTLQPLLSFKNDISILSGLLHQGAFKRNPTVVRHDQDLMCHLTAVDLARIPGVAVRNGISVDQLAARHLGEHTRLPYLTISTGEQKAISYTDSGSPIPSDRNPWEVFQRLFAGPTAADKRLAESRYRQQKSLLDDVLGETAKLNAALGKNDRERVEEYLTHLREVERRASVARRWSDVPLPKVPEGVKPPPKITAMVNGEAANFGAKVRLMLDMLVLALQTDQTRVGACVLGHMGDVYRELGLKDAYHGYTHHGNEPTKLKAMATIDRARIGHVAYFLEKLKAVKEADGSTLLDNCLVHFGGGMGAWHEATDLPNLIVGHGGGQFKLGEHLEFKQAPLANLFLTMLQAAGVPQKVFVDSTGPLGIG
jgi:hypothetical protein